MIEFANDSDFTRTHNGGFVNNGTVRKSGGVGETVLTDLNMDANGQTLDVDSGTLRTNSIGTWSGTTTITHPRALRSASSTAAAAAGRSRSTGR